MFRIRDLDVVCRGKGLAGGWIDLRFDKNGPCLGIETIETAVEEAELFAALRKFWRRNAEGCRLG